MSFIRPGRDAVGSYSTTFPNTENPFSDGSKWVMGGTDGIDWQNFQTIPGLAFGVGPSAGFDDCGGHLKSSVGVSSTKQFARSTVRRFAGYVPPSSHEIELWTFATITPNFEQLYECDFQFGSQTQFVRLKGSIGTFTVQGTGNWTDTMTGTYNDPQDGDVCEFRASISAGSPLLQLYVNGSLAMSVADTSVDKITSGQPGMGFFAHSGAGLDMTKFAWKTKFEAGTF